MTDTLLHSLTPVELARRWRCRPSRVRALIRTGQLAAIEIGGRCRITPEAIRAAEAGPLAVRPRVQRRRERIDPEVLRILNS